MLTNTQKIGLVLTACGAAAGLAHAQPFAVNGTGATLLENLFKAPAGTLDFIDVDGDGIVEEQLAPFDATSPFIASQYWQFNYRVVARATASPSCATGAPCTRPLPMATRPTSP